MAAKLKVLVVDDSQTIRAMMFHLITLSGDMTVVGQAEDGRQALEMTRQLGPDVILMDVVMPLMDGLEATRQIMQSCPTPIVMISASVAENETDIAFKAIKAGALTLLRKPGLFDSAADIQNLLGTLRAMAGVQVIHHWLRDKVAKPVLPGELELTATPQIVAIASSTGGPAALSEIICHLPDDFTVPVVIVQHIGADFVPSLVSWLNLISKRPVQVARHGERPSPGVIYIAGGGSHLRLSDQRTFVVTNLPGSARFMPSGDILLESVARAYGEQAVGIVLTGMGDDGAYGLCAMHQAGALTIAQDESSSVVFGMPREAIRLGAARQILPLPKIAQVLAHLPN